MDLTVTTKFIERNEELLWPKEVRSFVAVFDEKVVLNKDKVAVDKCFQKLANEVKMYLWKEDYE